MKVIVGLGNPGKEYEATRHNAAWWFIDHLARLWHFDAFKRDGDALSVNGLVGTQRVKLVKPQTYMNLSGSALRAYPRREGFDIAQDLLVIVDEVAIPVGEFRLRPFGSAGGHNGLKSVESHLKTSKYPRLRIGVRSIDERRLGGDLADYVLNVMHRDERVVVEELFPRMTIAVETWVKDGTEKAVSTMGR
jgi:PTH1 family peptidyl-tRNA hydrolase